LTGGCVGDEPRLPIMPGQRWIIRGVAALCPYLDHPRPVAFAHRGGAAHHPENSWAAFEYAASLGYAYLETDARSTADGALIAFHDADLDRATDRTGTVRKLSWREVSAARIAGTEEIPLLEDLIGSFGELRFNIDLKDEGTIAPLARVLRRTGAWERVCITSFSGVRLLAAQRSLDRPVCLAVTPAAIVALRYLEFPGEPANGTRGCPRRRGLRWRREGLTFGTLRTGAVLAPVRGRGNAAIFLAPGTPVPPEDFRVTCAKWGWTLRVTGILSGYPVLPIEIANRLGGSK
jgi:hypothetical protein